MIESSRLDLMWPFRLSLQCYEMLKPAFPSAIAPARNARISAIRKSVDLTM